MQAAAAARVHQQADAAAHWWASCAAVAGYTHVQSKSDAQWWVRIGGPKTYYLLAVVLLSVQAAAR